MNGRIWTKLIGAFLEYTNLPYKTYRFWSHLYHLLSQYSVTTIIFPLCSDSENSPFPSSFPRHFVRAFLLPSTRYSSPAGDNILQRTAYTSLCAEYESRGSLLCNLPIPLPATSTPSGLNIHPITFYSSILNASYSARAWDHFAFRTVFRWVTNLKLIVMLEAYSPDLAPDVR